MALALFRDNLRCFTKACTLANWLHYGEGSNGQVEIVRVSWGGDLHTTWPFEFFQMPLGQRVRVTGCCPPHDADPSDQARRGPSG